MDPSSIITQVPQPPLLPEHEEDEHPHRPGVHAATSAATTTTTTSTTTSANTTNTITATTTTTTTTPSGVAILNSGVKNGINSSKDSKKSPTWLRSLLCCFGQGRLQRPPHLASSELEISASPSDTRIVAEDSSNHEQQQLLVADKGISSSDSNSNTNTNNNNNNKNASEGSSSNSSSGGGAIVVQHQPQVGPVYKGKPLLPVVKSKNTLKKCVVIDLDETLVHSSFKPMSNADFIVPVEIDGTIHQVYVLKRPYVDEFLLRMGELFECVLFTASLAKYADPVADLLDKWCVFDSRLFRESCVFHRGNYVKDLSRLGRDLNQLVIIDNSPASYIFHPDNAVAVASWFDDMGDRELLDLIPFFESLSKLDSVYTALHSRLKSSNNNPTAKESS